MLILVFVFFGSCFPNFAFCQAEPPVLSGAARSAQEKIEAIQQNGESASPKPMTTHLGETEINSYLNSGAVKIPEGVNNVHMIGENGVVVGTAKVNFDQLKAGRRNSMNPLLAMFSGTHDIRVRAHVSAENGVGTVDVDTVEIDGVMVPRVAIELFADRYLSPRYPGIGTHSTFSLPDQIDNARVGAHAVTVIQR
ncbi:MAG: hypothetical protein JO041_10715 [Acidobacteria bacterium]|nr:hypothetical protein [Acidobacteriota bacterium]